MSVVATVSDTKRRVLLGSSPETAGMWWLARVYDSHPSQASAVFRTESINLQIIIGTYLVVREDETLFRRGWDDGTTDTCIPLEHVNHIGQSRKMGSQPGFAKEKSNPYTAGISWTNGRCKYQE